MKTYVLDTSALLAYIENEAGVDQVETLLLEALDEGVTLMVSVVSLIEVFYISLREQGETIARARLQLLKALPITIEEVSIKEIEAIGTLKSMHKVSFADSCIASLAMERRAVLVHKDPEFNAIAQLAQLKLPFKPKKGK